MSRPRSQSPHYRKFPWEEPGFDLYSVLAELDGSPPDRRLKKDLEDDHWDYLGEDAYPEGRRRSPPFPDDRHFAHRRHPDEEEFHRRKKPPHYGATGYEDRRLSQLRAAAGDGDRHGRGGFREHGFEGRARPPHSPPRLARERLPQAPRPPADHPQREPGTGWRREEQVRGRGRFRELTPGVRTGVPRGGAGGERGRRSAQGPDRNRRREEPHPERSPPFKRQRRETDDADHPGFRDEEDFAGQRFSGDAPRDGFGGGAQGSLPRRDARHARPLVIEHDHGIAEGRELPRWEQIDDHRDRDFGRQRSPPRPRGPSQERFRAAAADGRPDDREDARGRRFQDKWRDAGGLDAGRSPVPQDRPNPVRYGGRDGPVSHRGRGSSGGGGGGGPRPARGRLSRGQGGRTGPPRNQPQCSQGYQDAPREEQRPGYRPFREDCYEEPGEAEPRWAGEDRLHQWDHTVKPRSLDRRLPRDEFGPKASGQWECVWNGHKTSNMAAGKEETLTIKVDMSRPVNQSSSLCYSSDRQLSLDLVNVGRQRLDFLPMLEHSGTYRETAVHTGTFAQEIITLVHHVKEQYFRGGGATLNERFSGPQKGGYSEEETEELTLDERFSSTRGFSLNMSSLVEDDELLFSRLGPMQGLSPQPVRGPGDLRHDLERRRQERLEGVKVTIPGNSSVSRRALGPVSEPGSEYDELKDELAHMEEQGFSTWPEEPGSRRQEGGALVPRRGAPFRPLAGSQRRNHRFGHRVGPMRRQNNRSHPAGPSW